jgi:hypothetical protein
MICLPSGRSSRHFIRWHSRLLLAELSRLRSGVPRVHSAMFDQKKMFAVGGMRDHYRIVIETARLGLARWNQEAFLGILVKLDETYPQGTPSSPLCSKSGNVLRSDQMLWESSPIPHLDQRHRTGNSVVVIDGRERLVFQVTKVWPSITYQRMMDNGIGSDAQLQDLSLHIAPCLSFCTSMINNQLRLMNCRCRWTYYEVPHWIHLFVC